jgi:hypothetical protein
LTTVDKSPTVRRELVWNYAEHVNAVWRGRHTWDLEGEVQRSEHDGGEDPPATTAYDESASASSSLQGGHNGVVAFGESPVSGSEKTECGDEEGEDHDEDDISTEGTDHVDEAKDSHPKLEEACEDEWSAPIVVWFFKREQALPKVA